MITEDYVSFETAKLLNEKGFDSDDCIAIYDMGNNGAFVRDSGIFDNGPEDYLEFQWGEEWRRFGYYLAPTIQMAMKWLREVHGVHVTPKFDFYGGDYTGRIYDGRRETASEQNDYIAVVGYKTYNEAADAAIKYCLENLI